jgi:heptosyltransferase II
MGKCLNCIARLLDIIPEPLERCFCVFCGFLLYGLLPSRRYIILKNLHTVFPHKNMNWCRKLALVNCCRWAETVWLFLTGSVWSKRKIRQHFSVSPDLKRWIESFENTKKSAVVLVPHLNLMETMTWIPAFFDRFPVTGVVYRPFRSKWFERWIKTTRERFGLQLISRKRGVMPLEKILKNNGIVSILFDQSAGETGCLTTFFKRLASCTDLPGRLVEKYGSEVVAIYLKRTGFLKGELCIEKIPCQKETLSVTLEANCWLEERLANDPAFYENWLWMHRRWKIQHWPLRRFNIFQKRNLLNETCTYFCWPRLPRKTEVWIRMPDVLTDVVALFHLLGALRKARPDFHLHLLCAKTFISKLQHQAPVDFIHPLPAQTGWNYFKHFVAIQKTYPDVWINFADTFKSDLEAYLSGAKQRFGIQKHRWRFLLNYVFKLGTQSYENATVLGYKFLQAFGLKASMETPPQEDIV